MPKGHYMKNIPFYINTAPLSPPPALDEIFSKGLLCRHPAFDLWNISERFWKKDGFSRWYKENQLISEEGIMSDSTLFFVFLGGELLTFHVNRGGEHVDMTWNAPLEGGKLTLIQCFVQKIVFSEDLNLTSGTCQLIYNNYFLEKSLPSITQPIWKWTISSDVNYTGNPTSLHIHLLK